MKKLLLIMLSIFTIMNADAKDNLFERAQKREALKSKRFEQFNNLKSLNTNVNVPTLKKNSYWDNISLNWSPSDAVKTTYNNNRIESELSLSYTMDDTFYRMDYTYNGAGQVVLQTYNTYNPMNGTFIPVGKITNTYTKNGLRVVQVMEQKDTTGSNWVYSTRATYEMDDRGNYVEYGFENYNPTTNKWEIQMRYAANTTYYQNTRKIVSLYDSSYNSATQSMELEYKMLRNLNSSGQIITISHYEYLDGVESFTEYDSVFYDQSGIPTDLVMFDPSGFPTLTPMMKISELNWNGGYNPNLDLFDNEPIGYKVYSAGMQGWSLSSRNSTTFPDNNGSRIRLEELYENGNYIPSYRNSNLYDAKRNLIQESDENYDRITGKWITGYGSKYNYTYDMQGNASLLIRQYYNTMDSAYVNDAKIEMSGYISIVQGFTTNKNTLEAKLFPNPSTNGSVNINLKLEQASNLEIVLSDVSGKIISTESIYREKGMNTIKLDGLNKGMFIVSIKSENGIFRTKLLVE